MKICPTCKSKLFDDMDTCFGCMYRFGTDPEREREAEALSWPPSLEDVNEGAVFEEAVPWPAGSGPAPCPAAPPASSWGCPVSCSACSPATAPPAHRCSP